MAGFRTIQNAVIQSGAAACPRNRTDLDPSRDRDNHRLAAAVRKDEVFWPVPFRRADAGLYRLYRAGDGQLLWPDALFLRRRDPVTGLESAFVLQSFLFAVKCHRYSTREQGKEERPRLMLKRVHSRSDPLWNGLPVACIRPAIDRFYF
ncbi:hypothetical protein ACVW2L_000965 [Mucilaginibacter sp. HD30]